MEAAHALGHNGPPVPFEVLTHISEVLHTLKAALRDPAGVSAYYPMPEFAFLSSPEVQQYRHICPNEPGSASYPGGSLMGPDHHRTSAPALLQTWVQSYSRNAPHPGGIAFYAPPIEEHQYGSLRHSLSARTVLRPMSPIRPGTPLLPATARARDYATPVRPATVIATHITPRQVCRIVHSD